MPCRRRPEQVQSRTVVSPSFQATMDAGGGLPTSDSTSSAAISSTPISRRQRRVAWIRAMACRASLLLDLM
jgi:hypothetical protein